MLMDIYALRDLVCLFVDLYKNVDVPNYHSKYENVQSRNIYKFFKTVKYSEKHNFFKLRKLSSEGHNKYALPFSEQEQKNVSNR
jgi:hypothetical protein